MEETTTMNLHGRQVLVRRTWSDTLQSYVGSPRVWSDALQTWVGR